MTRSAVSLGCGELVKRISTPSAEKASRASAT
jgi:hypothetical protein